MATWRYVNVEIREARVLADLTGIDEDLKTTVEFCELLIASASPICWVLSYNDHMKLFGAS